MLKRVNSSVKIAIIINLLLVLFFLFRYNSLPVEIPLFYSMAPSDSLIVNLPMLLTLPILSFILIIINNLSVKKMFPDNEFLKQVIFYVNLIIIFVLSFIFVRIIFLVS